MRFKITRERRERKREGGKGCATVMFATPIGTLTLP